MISASVCTAIRAWIESSCLISADQPPFGLSPKSGTAWIDRILTAFMLLLPRRSTIPRPGLRSRRGALGAPCSRDEVTQEDAPDEDRCGRFLLSLDAGDHARGRRQPGRAAGAGRERRSCRLGRVRGLSPHLDRGRDLSALAWRLPARAG